MTCLDVGTPARSTCPRIWLYMEDYSICMSSCEPAGCRCRAAVNMSSLHGHCRLLPFRGTAASSGCGADILAADGLCGAQFPLYIVLICSMCMYMNPLMSSI